MNRFSRLDGNGWLLLPGIATACLLALAKPGHTGWWPLLFVALIPLLLTATHTTPGRSAWMGFVCGLLYHLALLYWILIVLGRYGQLPWWFSVPALVLLAAYMACYPAAFAFLLSLLAGRYRHRERSVALLVWGAPVLWVGLDYLKSIFLSGFPWMDLGYGLFSQPLLIQAADLGGHHLLTFSLILCNSLVAGMITGGRHAGRWHNRLDKPLLLLACCFLLGIGGYSFVRYQGVEGSLAKVQHAQVAVVQGNINQAVKWSAAMKEATVSQYLRLSQTVLQDSATQLVVWPETALPFYPQRDPLVARIVDFTTTSNTWLLTGAPLYSITPKPDGSDLIHYYNGALLVGPSGIIGGQYAKHHLVPFGEFVPFRRYLPFLEPLVVSIGDFTPGTSMEPLVLGPMKLGILICYESIFPEISRDSVVRGANLLVNLTNDAWYGKSSAPYQSLSMAVLRAVENRRSLIRAANTGISGFVDPLGRVTAQTAIFTEAALTAQVPMLDQATVFGRYGHLFGAVCLFLIPLLLLTFRSRRLL
jgi:apolipoprotein N-acyltransferase